MLYVNPWCIKNRILGSSFRTLSVFSTSSMHLIFCFMLCRNQCFKFRGWVLECGIFNIKEDLKKYDPQDFYFQKSKKKKITIFTTKTKNNISIEYLPNRYSLTKINVSLLVSLNSLTFNIDILGEKQDGLGGGGVVVMWIKFIVLKRAKRSLRVKWLYSI